MRRRFLLGCVGFALACVWACSVRRLSAQSAGTIRPEEGPPISRAGASNPSAVALPRGGGEESLSLEIRLGDREFSGDKALVPEDVFCVDFANASDRALEIWNPDEEIGWRQLSFELIDLQSGRKHVVTRRPFSRPKRQERTALQRRDEWGETVSVPPHTQYPYPVLLADCQVSDHDWTGLPTAELRQRFSLTARFESPSASPKRANPVWTGVLRSPSVNVRIANWQPHPPHYYLNLEFPEKALKILKAEPFWISKRDEDRQTPLHIAAARGDIGVVRWLLEQGADVNATAENNVTPLHLTHDPEIIRLILRKKPKFSIQDSATGQTVLQQAGEEWTNATTDDERRERRAIVQMYLDAGADYDIFTAIHLNELARVKVLLAKSPQFAHRFQWSNPLRKAASLGRLEICRYLIGQFHVDVNDFEGGSGYPIIKEALPYPEVVRLLIENGADLQKRITWHGGRSGMWIVGDEATALHYAAEDGVPATIQLLLDHGVDPFAIAKDAPGGQTRDQTPLDVAAIAGRADNAAAIVRHPRFRQADRAMRQRTLNRCLLSERWDQAQPRVDRSKLLEALLESGADPNTTANGVTPLQRSADEMGLDDENMNAGIREEINVLLRHGARLDLFSAVALGDEAAVVRFIKQDPTRTSVRSSFGYTPLHFAIDRNDERIVKALLNAGADLELRNRCDKRNDFGGTPLHTAVFWGRTSIARTLIEHGANVNAPSAKDEWTPLHAAVFTGNVEIARLLLEHGANAEAKNNKGHTPLQLGRGERSLAALEALFQKYEKHTRQ